MELWEYKEKIFHITLIKCPPGYLDAFFLAGNNRKIITDIRFLLHINKMDGIHPQKIYNELLL